MKPIREGLTFDDVLLVPAPLRACIPATSTSARASPAASASTSRSSAPPWTLSPSAGWRSRWRARAASASSTRTSRSSEQAREVDRVKRSESGMIVDPSRSARARRSARRTDLMARFHISGVPITDDAGGWSASSPTATCASRTDRDAPRRRGDDARRARHRAGGHDARAGRGDPRKHRIEKLPVVDAEGALRGLITVKDIEKRIGASRRLQGRARPAARRARRSAPAGDYLERARELVRGGRRRAGRRQRARPLAGRAGGASSRSARRSPTSHLVVGNVATGEGAARWSSAAPTR